MKRAFVLPLLLVSVTATGALGGWGLARYRLEQIHASAAPRPVLAQSGSAQSLAVTVPLPAALPSAPAAPAPVVPQAVAEHRAVPIVKVSPRPGPLPALSTQQAPALPPASLASAQPAEPAPPLAAAAPEDKPVAPLTPSGALKDGVLIVVSIPSQRLFVFKDGELWDSSRVSTGKPGKGTPAGTFTILEKKRRHRSTLYDDAPMPYMQRLTWGGVAMHGGRVPGYRASHGCIRLPHAFAKRLYGLTDYDSTVVVVTKKRAKSAEQALEAA